MDVYFALFIFLPPYVYLVSNLRFHFFLSLILLRAQASIFLFQVFNLLYSFIIYFFELADLSFKVQFSIFQLQFLLLFCYELHWSSKISINIEASERVLWSFIRQVTLTQVGITTAILQLYINTDNSPPPPPMVNPPSVP